MENSSIIHIAIADDHTLVLNGLVSLLQAHDNLKVDITASNGNDLLNQLSKATTLPDICLLDVQMPERDGYDTLLEIKKKWPQLPILIISMHDHEHVIINMLRNGASGYLLKSSSPEELYKAITHIIEKGHYHTDLVPSYFSKASEIPRLSKIEHDFLIWCCEDLSYKEIANEMKVLPRTIESYRDSLFTKLHVKSRTGLVMFAMRNGFLS